ncbi:4Fe-4S binding protein, partial [Victivallis vadensis]
MRRLPRILRIVAAAVSLVISLSLFCGSGVALSNWAAFQLGPALARLAAAFTFGALGIAVLILALTFLFGRFYCVLLCPLGILQDLIGALSFRKSRPVKNFPLVRYWVLLA